MLLKYLLTLSTILFTNTLNAKPLILPSGILQSTNEPSSLEMFCRGEEPYETMDCEFIQKSIRKTNPKPDEEVANFDKTDKKDLKQMEVDLKKQCKTIPSTAEDIQSSLRRTQEKENEIMSKLCECNKSNTFKSCFKNLIVDMSAMKEKTCMFAVRSFTEGFKKIGKNKWMNTPKPVGLCNTVTAITLEHDNNSKWTYTQTRLSTDEDELCKLETNIPVIYKTGPTTHNMGCEYIDLGFSL